MHCEGKLKLRPHSISHQLGSCYSIFSFISMFCRSLFVLLYFFFWPLCFLFFFDIRFLIAPLVSSNYSSKEIKIKPFLRVLYVAIVVQDLPLHRTIYRNQRWPQAGVEFKQKFQLDSRTSRYKNQLAPQIFYQPDHHGDNY